MTVPPYNYDVSNPATTGTPSSFPANEQAFRSTVAAAVGTVVEPVTGLGPLLVSYTTTQRNALVNPPTGLLIYNSTVPALQVNTGTPGSPVWKGVTVA